MKYPPSTPVPNSQAPENLYFKWYNLPFPTVDTHAVWVTDDHANPIVGATLSWVGPNQEMLSSKTDGQGLANLGNLPLGWTKLEIRKSGFLSQNDWVKVEPNRKLQVKIALGKPGDYMMPGRLHFFPVHDPKFRLALTPRSDELSPETFKGTEEQRNQELQKLIALLPGALRPYASQSNFPLPQDPNLQFRVMERIKSSPYFQPDLVCVLPGSAGDAFVVKGGWCFSRIHIDAPKKLIGKEALESELKKYGFEVIDIVDGGVTPNDPIWRVRANYKLGVGPGFLNACSKLHQALPTSDFMISSTVGAEPNR